MRKPVYLLLGLVCVVGLLSQVTAQPPAEEPARDKPKDYSNAPIVTRMLAFDKNKDGKLTKDEVTDVRLHRLFDRADTNKDGIVTKEELLALAAKLEEEERQDGDRGGRRGPGGRGDRGGPDDRGPGDRDDRRPGGRGDRGGPGDRGPGGGPDDRGPGGRGPGGRGPGGPPQPGQILPPFLQDRLNLSADQKKQLDALQKEVDAKLAKILTDEQKKQLKEMREAGPGGRGPGGPGGRGEPAPGGPGGRGDRGPGGPGGPGGDRGPRDGPPDRER